MGDNSAVGEDLQLQKGSQVEVYSGEDWWDAEVTKIKGGQARVHYVGGSEDDDEWINLKSGRIRPRQTAEVSNESGSRPGKRAREHPVEIIPVPSSLPFKQGTIRDATKRRQWKNLKKILEAENYDKLPLDAPTYTNVEAPPSLLPAKKYCDLSGLEAPYTDPKTRLRYFSAAEYAQVKHMPDHSVQEFLKFRNATVALK